MTDNEFNELFTNFESKYVTFLSELYPELPTEIINNLAEYIESYDINRVKYNVFALDFNEYYKRQLVSMLEGDSNLLFFGIPTKYHKNENLWNRAKKYAVNAYGTINQETSIIILLHILLTVLKYDGFRIATEIYKDR